MQFFSRIITIRDDHLFFPIPCVRRTSWLNAKIGNCKLIGLRQSFIEQFHYIVKI